MRWREEGKRKRKRMEDENPAEVVDRRLLREGGSAVSAVYSSPIRTSVAGTLWQNLDGSELMPEGDPIRPIV